MAEPTLERLQSAFMNAHKAGDKKAAGVLAAEIKRRRALDVTPPVVPKQEGQVAEIDYVAADAETDMPTPADMARQRLVEMRLMPTPEQTAQARKIAPGVAREAISGLTFGGMDEILGVLAAGQATITGEDPRAAAQKIMQKFRGQREQFQKEYPKTALAAEIAGSIPTAVATGGAAAATKLGQAAPRMTQIGTAMGESGLYGLLSAEGDIQERLPEAGVSMAAGGLLGAGGQFLPRVTEPAKRLIEEKIQPTIGQAFGPTIKALEERATSIPLIGDVIRAGQREVIQSFDNKMIEKALAPIGFKVPAGKTGVQAMEAAEDALSDAYRKAVPKAGLPNARPLQSRINEIVQENTDLPKDIFDQLRKKLNKTIAPSLFDEGYKMSGEAIKKADSYLGKEAIGYIRTGDPDKQQMGRALFKMQSALRDELISQNPSAKGLSAAREAYKQILPIRKAATAAPADVGTFTPAQLLRGMKSADVSVGKTRFATGAMPEQELAMTAQEVLGKRIPDSGTMERGLFALMAAKPGIALATGAGAIGAQPFYQTQLGRMAARKILETPGAALRRVAAVPAIPGMAGGLLAGPQE